MGLGPFASHYVQPTNMYAVLAALLISVPFLTFYLIQFWWIRRSPTAAIAKRRRTFVIVFIIVALATFKLFTADTKLHRLVLNKCALEISNESGEDLYDIEYILHYSGGEIRTNRDETLSPRSARIFTASGPNLVVQSIRGHVGTNQFFFTGRVNKGDRLRLRITKSAQVTAQLD